MKEKYYVQRQHSVGWSKMPVFTTWKLIKMFISFIMNDTITEMHIEKISKEE